MPIDRKKNFTWKAKRKGTGCAKTSFRVKHVSASTLIRFCCPKGKWRSGYCHGGVVVQAIGKKRGSR